jgi:predicted PurR-regulated permease PerM
VKPVLNALSLTLVLAYVLHPVVEKIHPIVKRRWLAISLTFLFILLPFFVFFAILTSTIVSELIEFSRIPQVRDVIDLLGENFKRYLELPPEGLLPSINDSNISTFGDVFNKGFGRFVNFIKALGGLFMQILLGIFFTIYVLFKKDAIYEVFSSIKNKKIKNFILFVDEGLKQLVYSMFLTALVTGIIAVITYTVFGVPFALLLGVTTGIVALIPVMGTWLVYAPISIYFLIQGKTVLALSFLAVSIIFLSTLPDVAVRPILAGKKVDVGLIILGLITGTLAFGTVGVILGPLIIIAWVGYVKIFLIEDKNKK